MWKDYLPEKDKHVIAQYTKDFPLYDKPNDQAKKLVEWEKLQDVLDSIKPCDDFKDKDEGRFVLTAWWGAAKYLGLLTFKEYNFLVRVAIDILYF